LFVKVGNNRRKTTQKRKGEQRTYESIGGKHRVNNIGGTLWINRRGNRTQNWRSKDSRKTYEGAN